MIKLECMDVHKAYGSRKVLCGIDLELLRGDIIGICGDNGCGKSTLLSILAGVERADRGRVTLNGKDVRRIRDLPRRIGYVPQNDPIPGNVKVREILGLWCASRSGFDSITEEYELGDMLNMRVDKLSGGMRRRVSVACASASGPEMLILDEPATAMDMHFRELLYLDLVRTAGQGTGIVMVSHDPDELALCNTCFRIIDGKNERI
ncbi:MAG: ABC transporter ATP-binding protein [Lachnospiraceae bacterium]|nr:ABC transporter ATP-binding protein [Lachnospiraceae bacterium]